ncbi:hypothetical protein PR048_019393 [Dryococelus australis]|uniref:Uncharacterized protein n=1 Tax=Dryococelus australis TaxID=614101 RepID=A0ABQ9H3D9_9NEOP|nr:hypothetical protein PR048_019393 [Dryococelus australis]
MERKSKGDRTESKEKGGRIGRKEKGDRKERKENAGRLLIKTGQILRLETRRTRSLSLRHCTSKTSGDGGMPSTDIRLVISLLHHGQIDDVPHKLFRADLMTSSREASPELVSLASDWAASSTGIHGRLLSSCPSTPAAPCPQHDASLLLLSQRSNVERAVGGSFNFDLPKRRRRGVSQRPFFPLFLLSGKCLFTRTSIVRWRLSLFLSAFTNYHLQNALSNTLPVHGRFILCRSFSEQLVQPLGRDVKPTLGATVAERLDCSPPTKTKRVQSPVGSLPDFRKWESSCRMMPLAGGLSRGSPISPRPYFPALLFLASFHRYRLSGLEIRLPIGLVKETGYRRWNCLAALVFNICALQPYILDSLFHIIKWDFTGHCRYLNASEW